MVVRNIHKGGGLVYGFDSNGNRELTKDFGHSKYKVENPKYGLKEGKLTLRLSAPNYFFDKGISNPHHDIVRRYLEWHGLTLVKLNRQKLIKKDEIKRYYIYNVTVKPKKISYSNWLDFRILEW